MLCSRNYGMGADGLIEVTNKSGYEMILRNADASSAEMSGNGLRCLGHFLTRGESDPNETIEVRTKAGNRAYRRLGGVSSRQAYRVRGETSMSSGEILERIEVDGYPAWRVDMGNPHLVIFGPDLDEDPRWLAELDIEERGAAISASTPGGSNVEWTSRSSDGSLMMRVWERGVGPTLACGTGSCAAYLANFEITGSHLPITVHNPGGDLGVREGDGSLWLQGESVFVGEIQVTPQQLIALVQQ